MMYNMKRIFLSILFTILTVSAFRSTSSGRLSISRTLKMQEGEAPKEWVGAKKFSMKDRYTETKISSEQISKILPHR